MAGSTTSVVIAPLGVLTLKPNVAASFVTNWGANISSLRWTRVWPGLESPGDADSSQSVTIQSEGQTWSLSNPTTTFNATTLLGRGQSGASIVVRLQVMTSQVDTF